MSFGGNPTMKSGPPIQPVELHGANAGIWSPPPQGTYTPSTAPTSVWTHNPNAGVQTGIPQGGHAQGAIAQYLQGTSPTKLSYDSAAHDAWLNDALEKARKAGEVRYGEPKQKSNTSSGASITSFKPSAISGGMIGNSSGKDVASEMVSKRILNEAEGKTIERLIESDRNYGYEVGDINNYVERARSIESGRGDSISPGYEYTAGGNANLGVGENFDYRVLGVGEAGRGSLTVPGSIADTDPNLLTRVGNTAGKAVKTVVDNSLLGKAANAITASTYESKKSEPSWHDQVVKQARDKKNKEAEKALRSVNPESTFRATTTGKGYIGGLNKGGLVKGGPIGRGNY